MTYSTESGTASLSSSSDCTQVGGKILHRLPTSGRLRRKDMKSREKIIVLLSQDNSLSAAALAERIGITPKAVEKHIARMEEFDSLAISGP